jgi:hypothetical protein
VGETGLEQQEAEAGNETPGRITRTLVDSFTPEDDFSSKETVTRALGELDRIREDLTPRPAQALKESLELGTGSLSKKKLLKNYGIDEGSSEEDQKRAWNRIYTNRKRMFEAVRRIIHARYDGSERQLLESLLVRLRRAL